MRHKLSGRQLSRNSAHRHALMRNMAGSLLRHETIRTTLPKAKELRRVVEPLITLGKNDSDANRRVAFARLRDGEVVTKLFGDIGPRFRARPGGYTRILRMLPRAGDAAPMALMQLVDRPAPQAVPAASEPAAAADRSVQARAARPAKAPKAPAAPAKRAKTAKAPARARVAEEPEVRSPSEAKKTAKKAAKKTAAKSAKKKSAK